MTILSLILLLIFGLFIIASLIHVGPPIHFGKPLSITAESPDKIKAISSLYSTMIKGWNNGDGNLYATVFTEEADYITFNGELVKGQKGIGQSHQKLFEGPLKGSTLENQKIISIRLVSDDIALVHMIGYVKLKWRKKAPESRKSVQTLVAVKSNGEWKFTAFHNSRVHRFTLLDGLKMFLS